LTPSEKSRGLERRMATTAPTAADAWNAKPMAMPSRRLCSDRLLANSVARCRVLASARHAAGLRGELISKALALEKEHTIEQEVDEKSRSGACKHLGYAKGRRTQFQRFRQ